MTDMAKLGYQRLASDEVNGEPGGLAASRLSATSRYSRALSITSLLVWAATVAVWLFLKSQESHINLHHKATSSYSPIYDLLDLDAQTKRVNGTLFPPDDPSVARQMPGPDADALWSEIEVTRVFPVSGRDLARLGKDAATAVRLEDDVWGEGEDRYASVLDMFHQLHCLNSLRKIIYGRYYDQVPGDHEKPKRHHEMHINHCMDILYQSITCSNNLNLITLHWAEGQPGPFPDMSINRQCVNFDKILQWRKENTIDMDQWIAPGVMDKPEGHAEMPWGVEIP
ncbi:hypothetical protein GGR56DRAFT_515208 [Xylariaceae sp. FL0804]|nr:hypothetical protein GGR56DRAFT_515208 [Xylariaceae sp. FL0804]